MKRKEKRTYADRAEYMIKATAKRRKRLKTLSIEYKGGKCAICNYKKCVGTMVIHHKTTKKRNLGYLVEG